MSYEQATLVALILGPVAAVLITLWAQARQQKHDARERLFLTLMAHRKSVPLSPEWINGLNLIDVVYGSRPKVVGLWHALYANYSQKPPDLQQRVHLELDLLAAMANELGYKVGVTDIDKFYTPQGQIDQQTTANEMQKELLRVLKASESFGVTPRKADGQVLLPPTAKG